MRHGTARRLAAALAAALVGATVLVACDLPPGFPRVHGLLGAQPADQRRVRPRRARVRRREARRGEGVRQRRRLHADGRGRPADEGLQRLGPGPARPGRRPGLRQRPGRVRRSTRSTSCPAARSPPGEGPARTTTTAPRRPGYTDDGCVVMGRAVEAAAEARRHLDRAGGRADRRLVPAVPEPLDRHARLRARRLALRRRRRRRQLQLRRLRPGGQPPEPLRRPAGGRRRHPGRGHGRGRGAALAGPAHAGRPHDGRRRDHPGRRRHRGTVGRTTRSAASTNPAPGGSSPTASGTPTASRCAPAPTSCGSATSAGTRSRRSTARSATTPPSTTSGGPATRAAGRMPRCGTRSTSPCASRSTPRAPRR